MEESRFKIKTEVENDSYAKFAIEPLSKGYGHTLGTSLRRVLLNSLQGASVTMIKVGGVKHQFSTLAGMKEDIVELILNVKKIRLTYAGTEPIKMKLSVKGKTEATAGDIEAPSQVTIANPEQYLATLTSPKSKLDIEFWVESGYGYSPFEDRKGTEIGIIPIDAVFTPILRVNYKIESTRVGRVTDLDKLIMEIWTDGSIRPLVALQDSARILNSYLTQFYTDDEAQTEDVSSAESLPNEASKVTIEELDLPTRIANALKNGGIETVGDLMKRPRRELMKIKNVGGKSLGLVEDELRKKGINIKQVGE